MNPRKRYRAALTIAGSDSGGGAGIQADLKAFSAIGVFGTSVITSITSQNTYEVRSVEVMRPEIVRSQLEAVLDDITIDAVKTGMLPTPEIIETVASVIDTYRLKKIVIDPVMVATSGARLATAPTVASFRKLLYPRLSVITPNIPEAEVLSGVDIKEEADMYRAGEKMLAEGCRGILLKGGHLAQEQSVDILFTPDMNPIRFEAPRVKTENLHGTGCTLASAITAYLALGLSLEEAIDAAKQYITHAIRAGAEITTGKGHGPVNHFFHPQTLKSIHI